MNNQNTLVNKKYLLQKFNGKGGWTYAKIPEVLPDKHAHFGWVKVCGSIDGVELKRYKLMPMGNGRLFLPVNAEIRKKINKQAGDYVHVILYNDTSSLEIPPEFALCLHDSPKALSVFSTLSDEKKEAHINWVYASKKEDTKAKRIAQTIQLLEQNDEH